MDGVPDHRCGVGDARRHGRRVTSRPAPYRVLQVGCGPTGTSVLRELLPKLADAGVAVSYEVADPAVMGPGLAFATPFDHHLLNVAASRMSLHSAYKAEFHRWRAERSLGAEDYPPR